jgi:hypothetical protein
MGSVRERAGLGNELLGIEERDVRSGRNTLPASRNGATAFARAYLLSFGVTAWDSYSYGEPQSSVADRGGLELELRHPCVLADGDRCGGLPVMLTEHAHHGRR